jgi:hypothetical protein
MSSYTVTEPHPTVPKGSYARSGRGGAGNFFRAPATTPAAGVPTTAKPAAPAQERFYSGRGGAGNAHPPSDRPLMSFDEQYKLQSHIECRASGHVGRGGAGNVYASGSVAPVTPGGRRKDSDASSRHSNSSASSVKSGFLARLTTMQSRGPM